MAEAVKGKGGEEAMVEDERAGERERERRQKTQESLLVFYALGSVNMRECEID